MNHFSPFYINASEIQFYCELYKVPYRRKNDVKWSTEVSLPPFFKLTQHIQKNPEGLLGLQRAEDLWEHVKSRQLFLTERPVDPDCDIAESDLLYEEVTARKFVFPKSKLSEIHGLEELVVWITAPNEQQLTAQPFDCSGTFVILVQTLYDRVQFRTHLSGCSALQALSNLITDQPFYTQDREEPYGRRNIQHPFQKMENMGAIYLQEQSIRVLYRMRYMSNEQRFEYKGSIYRCYDLLAYPLIIS